MQQKVNEPSGAALVARIKAEMAEEGLEPDAREVEFLAIAEGLQDRIVELEAAIEQHGLTNVTKGGLVRLNPAVVEARQTRAALVSVAALRSRWDQSGPKCFRIERDDLIPEDYERLSDGDAAAADAARMPAG